MKSQFTFVTHLKPPLPFGGRFCLGIFYHAQNSRENRCNLRMHQLFGTKCTYTRARTNMLHGNALYLCTTRTFICTCVSAQHDVFSISVLTTTRQTPKTFWWLRRREGKYWPPLSPGKGWSSVLLSCRPLLFSFLFFSPVGFYIFMSVFFT